MSEPSRTFTADFCDALLDDSHRALRDAVARFTRDEITPHAWEWEEAELFDRELWRKAGAAGVLGPALPEAYGGGGGDVFHAMVATEEMLRGGSTGTVAGLGSLEIALPPILSMGTEDQKQRFIPPCLTGERIAALAITEPGAGSDVTGVRTRARREGDAYVLNGSKLYVTSGVRCDQLTLLARTSDDPHGGLTFFVVERELPGVLVSRSLKKTGWRASDTAELTFSDVRVPSSHRLGEEGSGFVCLMQTFQWERIYLATQGYAIAEICLEEALAYARARETFGKPLTRHQVVRHKLSEMASRVLAAKSLTYQCALRLKQGDANPAEVSVAKNVAADAAEWVAREAVQIFGGMGYMRETLVERLSRDARLLNVGGGTHEIMNEIVAKGLGL